MISTGPLTTKRRGVPPPPLTTSRLRGAEPATLPERAVGCDNRLTSAGCAATLAAVCCTARGKASGLKPLRAAVFPTLLAMRRNERTAPA